MDIVVHSGQYLYQWGVRKFAQFFWITSLFVLASNLLQFRSKSENESFYDIIEDFRIIVFYSSNLLMSMMEINMNFFFANKCSFFCMSFRKFHGSTNQNTGLHFWPNQMIEGWNLRRNVFLADYHTCKCTIGCLEEVLGLNYHLSDQYEVLLLLPDETIWEIPDYNWPFFFFMVIILLQKIASCFVS